MKRDVVLFQLQFSDLFEQRIVILLNEVWLSSAQHDSATHLMHHHPQKLAQQIEDPGGLGLRCNGSESAPEQTTWYRNGRQNNPNTRSSSRLARVQRGVCISRGHDNAEENDVPQALFLDLLDFSTHGFRRWLTRIVTVDGLQSSAPVFERLSPCLDLFSPCY